MSQERLAQMQAELLKTLGHPTRIKILQYLRGGEQCVCDIIEFLGLEQSNVSQHLAVLKRQDILTSEKDGLRVLYSVKNPLILKILDQVTELLHAQIQDSADILKSYPSI